MLNDVTFKNIRRGDVTLRVALTGHGPLVLMVHGFPDQWISWHNQIGTIASAGFTVAALETRGYGESSKPTAVEAYGIIEMATDIAAVIETLDPAGAVLIGHDWGAIQNYTAAMLYPKKVRAVVGVSSPANHYSDRRPSTFGAQFHPNNTFYQDYFAKPGVAEAELEADPARFVRTFHYALSGDRPDDVNGLIRPGTAVRLLDGLPDPDPFPAWLTAEDIQYYAKSFAQGGFRGPLNRYRAQDLDVDQMRPYANLMIEQPALFIGGARDPARFMAPGQDRYRDPVPRFADPRGIHILDGVGHWPHQEAALRFNSLILPFLAAVCAEIGRPS